MIDDVQKLLDQYLLWLKDKTSLRQVKDWIEITTPYLDRHNDYMQIYVKRENGNFVITDDGYTIEDLRLSGCELETKKRKDLLNLTLNGFGVKIINDELIVHASPDTFALRKHNLVQAMLAVNDLFYLAVPMVASLFLEDVSAWLDLSEIRYTPKVKFTGKSGYDHLFDFVIPASKKQPERILQTINRPSRDTAQAVAFSWIDTKEVRPANSRAYAFLNDSEHAPTASVLDALKNYDVSPVLWSKREELREELAA
ncbi:MAG: DUF1829 domain-containing protein [Nitrospirae bacterium]|nr:DUF1829 domain-containing protein [Nitrospirota bacterium]